MSIELIIALFGIGSSFILGTALVGVWVYVLRLKESAVTFRQVENGRYRSLVIKYHALIFMQENDELDETEALALAEEFLSGYEFMAKNDLGMYSAEEVERG